MEIGTKLKHVYEGVSGELIKITYPTGKPMTFVIKLNDGRVYFAPSGEFVLA